MDIERAQHYQQTFSTLGDEFLAQYFLSAHKAFRGNQILSRLFSMGHSLELYLKAALVDEQGAPPLNHDISGLLSSFNSNLCLTPEELQTGEKLFSSSVNIFDLGLYDKHEEALELYQAMYFVKDIKYYLTKDGKVVFPCRVSLKPINMRYMHLVKEIRKSIKHRPPQQDKELIDLISHLGFEINPATYVIT